MDFSALDLAAGPVGQAAAPPVVHSAVVATVTPNPRPEQAWELFGVSEQKPR